MLSEPIHLEPGDGGQARKERHGIALLLLKRSSCPGDRLLDIGCGPGEFMALTQGLSLFRRFALDVDVCMVRQAKQRNAGLHPVGFVVGAAEALPFLPNIFDVTTSFCVVEHAESPLRMLREIKRVLRPDRGRALLSTPNLGRPSRLLLAMLQGDHEELTGHYQGWDYHLLVQVLEKVVGLRVRKYLCRFVDCPGHRLWPGLGRWFSYRVLRRLFPRIGSEMYFVCAKEDEDG